jgi:hypothetical protein
VSLRLSIGVVAAFLAISASAFGATFEVTSEADEGPGSLGETILEAGPGDTIEIPPGTYLLTNGDTPDCRPTAVRAADPGTQLSASSSAAVEGCSSSRRCWCRRAPSAARGGCPQSPAKP